MADAAKQRLELSDFPGLAIYTDESDQPPGTSVEQTNLNCLVMGQMQVRRGYSFVQFEEEE